MINLNNERDDARKMIDHLASNAKYNARSRSWTISPAAPGDLYLIIYLLGLLADKKETPAK